MTDDPQFKMGKALDQFTGMRGPVTDSGPQSRSNGVNLPGDFAQAKLSVIRPAFETIGNGLRERGHDIHISEGPGEKISIHIVPAGVSKSIHPYDWFPTLSFFDSPYTKTIGLQGRNMRPNSEGSAGSRGDYKPVQIDRALVEKELMKFIGEIANW